MQAAADTNLLVYAEGLHGAAAKGKARRILRRLSETGRLVVPVQVLGELYRVLRRKAKLDAADARRSIEFWTVSARLGGTTADAFADAIELATGHGFDIWDAVILAVASRSGCGALLSEDMHQGFVWRGCTIVNPLAARPHRLLSAILS